MDRIRVRDNSRSIAVIGLAIRFPGALSPSSFWENLKSGTESIKKFTTKELLKEGVEEKIILDPNFVPAGGIVEGIENFDAEFFNFTPREAEIMDPQQRLMIEVAYEALEDAGYNIDGVKDSIGVYVGVGMNGYFLNNLLNNQNLFTSLRRQIVLSNDKDYAATHISHKLNLKGPSINIGTACSTSLVTIHQACQSLLAYECDISIAGGANINVSQKKGYLYQQGNIFSLDGHCRAFDKDADGTIGGNGIGIVVLKRLEEAIEARDHIYAVVKGSAINNDGFKKVSYTAPSIEGQSAVIYEAQIVAGVDADSVSYVEAHGTGTLLGDPIEVAALTEAFRASTNKKSYCALGSVKTNIGHLDTAAGVAGFIKTVLSLYYKKIPASLHYKIPNPQIDFENSPFYVNTETRDWPQINNEPRRAGVSSFGMGGTNAHVILEEAPMREPSGPSRKWQLITLSTKSETTLERLAENLSQFLQTNEEPLADVAYTLQVGREAFTQRAVVLCQDRIEGANALHRHSGSEWITGRALDNPVISFLFSGQGFQHINNMCRSLYEREKSFSSMLNFCTRFLQPYLGVDICELIYSAQNNTPEAIKMLRETRIAQPVLFSLEYSLAHLWNSWGIKPQMLLGYDSGEYVAACLAGVFSLETALHLVALRGELIHSMPPGKMLSVYLEKENLSSWLDDTCSIAAVNLPEICVVSGSVRSIEALEKRLKLANIRSECLDVSHAFHSSMMDPVVDRFVEEVAKVERKAPTIKFISNIKGNWISANEATDPYYWGRHIRETIHFSESVGVLLDVPNNILLEVGPNKNLSHLVTQNTQSKDKIIISGCQHAEVENCDQNIILNALGRLWSKGVKVDWNKYYTNEERHRVSLPTYPFERKRYWIEPDNSKHLNSNTHSKSNIQEKIDTLNVEAKMIENVNLSYALPFKESSANSLSSIFIQEEVAKIWSKVLGISEVTVNDNFFELGGNSLMAINLTSELSKIFKVSCQSHAIIEFPTVNLQALYIEKLMTTIENNTNQKNNYLIKIRNGSSNLKPLFLVPPAGGNIYLYNDLARSLGGQYPIYTFKSPGLDGDSTLLHSIADTASFYLTLIETFPEGYYNLGGSSYGGIVAYEIAQQLLSKGKFASNLILLDTLHPKDLPKGLDDELNILTHLTQSLKDKLFSSTIHKNNDQSNNNRHELYFSYLKRLQSIGILSENTTMSQLLNFLAVFKSNMQAMYNYTPQPYMGRLTYFKASVRRNDNDIKNSELAWVELAKEGIDIFKIPGDHITMNHSPNVLFIAKILEMIT